MGREVRRVPATWVHPGGEDPVPLFNGIGFSEKVRMWDEGKAKWDEGLTWDYFRKTWAPQTDAESKCASFEEWDGPRPKPEDYMPEWPESERTHYQMYENVSEGTPISPVCATPEELAHWLADNNASASGHLTASYEQWLHTIQRGYAPSMVVSAQGMTSGVAALHDLDS